MKKILITAFLSILASISFAEILMPRIFSDNMVLQADLANKFWGTSLANADISVVVGGKSFFTRANSKGEWSLKTSALKKSFSPIEIVVSENGKVQKAFKNILIGEVWVLGGQSNMQWALRNTTDFESVKERINPSIRIFKQPFSQMAATPQHDFHSTAGWVGANKNSIPNASAIGYYFAEMLSKKLQTPVGLIETPLGGSRMIAWLPKEKLTSKFLKGVLEEFEAKQAKYDYLVAKKEFDEKLKRFDAENHGQKLSENIKAKRNSIVRLRPNPQSVWRAQETPCFLYNAKIAPLAGIAARGFLWYQGESDAGKLNADNFDETFAILINTWREVWRAQEMPFYFFQLPSFATRSNWATVRVKQQKTSKEVAGAYMISIIDSGEEKDIHPRDKTFVTKRLFASVMKNTYKNNSFKYESSELASIKAEGNKAVLTFDKKITGEGLPRGFEVLCAGKWISAKAKQISSMQIELSSDQPISGVRYLWKSWARPDVWLYCASSDVPVSTFEALIKQ